MNNMNLCFLDFWNDFDKNNNFFIHYFKLLFPEKTINVTSESDADLVIFSCFGKQHKNVNRSKTKKIFFTGENIRPNFYECDYSFTFDLDDYNGKNIRIPLWYFYIDWFNVGSYGNPKYLLPVNEIKGLWFNKEKTKTSCAVFSSPKPERFFMINCLSKYFPVDCYGKPFGKHTSGEDDKYNTISQYKISMCFENSLYPGYVTEKLFHSRTAGNLSLYWGHSDVKYDFNPKGFINANDFNSFEECAEYVNYLLNNDTKYNEIIQEPIFSCNFFDFEKKIKSIL